MKLVVPQNLERKELHAWLRNNEKAMIAQKKALPVISDNLDFGYNIITGNKQFAAKAKANDGNMPNMDSEIDVEVIANLSGWCDSHMDVMIKDNWNKSINDTGASGQKLIYHLKDHGTNYQYTLDSIIGKNCNLFTRNVDLGIFNIKSDVRTAQALVMASTVVKEYDEKAFYLYKDGQIKQHSIGLQYYKIYLCIDSIEPEDAMYKENWDKYYQQVINKEKVDAKGYFWAVTESRILEVSAVLFGSNELTPVLSTSAVKNNTEEEPPVDTPPQPLPQKTVNWDKVLKVLQQQ